MKSANDIFGKGYMCVYRTTRKGEEGQRWTKVEDEGQEKRAQAGGRRIAGYTTRKGIG